MKRSIPLLALLFAGAGPTTATAQAAHPAAGAPEVCVARDYAALHRNPTRRELRCRFGVKGPGRFGLLSYMDVPVYQPATPMPGTHLVGVTGHASPRPGESYEEWEWRVLRTEYGPEATTVLGGLELLDPFVATRVLHLERRLAEEGVPAARLESWRDPRRQAYLFQRGRSRPGSLATATLTSWHGTVDAAGRAAGRAVDYAVPAAALPRFHEIVAEVGLAGYGAESLDPGHVFLPPDQPLPAGELALLRTLPRVPEVTLATGLPVDRPLPAGGLDAVREASLFFAAGRFVPVPVAEVVARRPARPRVLAPVEAALNPAPAPARPADGGGPGAPRGSAPPEGEGSARSRGG